VTRVATERDDEPVWRAVVHACGPLPPPIRVAFRAEDFRRVGGATVRPLGSFNGRAALLFSGVGNAASFHGLVCGLGLNVRDTVVFPDHVHYTSSIVATLRQRAGRVGADLMLTTEKDAGKVAPFLSADDDCWAVRLRTEVVAGNERVAQLLQVGQPAAIQEGRA
jgi:tetraacyldisaccharide 4'-kinase